MRSSVIQEELRGQFLQGRLLMPPDCYMRYFRHVVLEETHEGTMESFCFLDCSKAHQVSPRGAEGSERGLDISA